MKKKFLLFVLILVFAVATKASAAVTVINAYPEAITKYAVTLSLDQSGILRVSENITYNFGTDQRHGIFRIIAIAPDSDWPALGVSDLNVTDPVSGSTYVFATSQDAQSYTAKIGNPNILVTGKKQYQITYDVTNAVRSFLGHDELNWDAVGTQWSVPVSNATVKIMLPANTPTGTISASCDVGIIISGKPACSVSSNRAGTTIAVSSEIKLPPNNGFVVSVSLPKGFIANAATSTADAGTASSNPNGNIPIVIGIIIMLIVVAFGFALYR